MPEESTNPKLVVSGSPYTEFIVEDDFSGDVDPYLDDYFAPPTTRLVVDQLARVALLPDVTPTELAMAAQRMSFVSLYKVGIVDFQSCWAISQTGVPYYQTTVGTPDVN